MPSPRAAALACLASALVAGAAHAQTVGTTQVREQAPGPLPPHLLDPTLSEVVGDTPFAGPVQTPPVVEFAPTPRQPLEPGWHFGAVPYGRVYGRSDLQRGPGSLQTNRVGVDLDALRRTEAGDDWLLQLEAEGSKYDFRDATDLVQFSDRPIEDTLRTRLGAAFQSDRDERWSARAAFALSASGEANAELGDSIYVAGGATLEHRLQPDLAFVGGAYVWQEFEEDPFVLPIFGVHWEFTDRTRFQTIGPGYELSHDVRDDLRLFLRGAYEMRQYRMDGVGALPGGAFRDREVNVLLGLDWDPGLTWSFLEGARFRGTVGANVYRRFYFYNDDQRVSVDQQDQTYVLGLHMLLRF